MSHSVSEADKTAAVTVAVTASLLCALCSLVTPPSSVLCPQRHDEAEALYREIDRKDLAIQMRKRMGDYPRVVQLLQTGGGNDLLMRVSELQNTTNKYPLLVTVREVPAFLSLSLSLSLSLYACEYVKY